MRFWTQAIEGTGTEDLAPVHGLVDGRSSRGAVAGRGEVLAVPGEHGVPAVGRSLQEGAEKVGGDARGGAPAQLGERELRDAVDGNDAVQSALLGPDLGDVGVEDADRVGLEALAGQRVAVGFGQARAAVAPEAAMQRRALQVRDEGRQGVEAIVEREQGVTAEREDDRLLPGLLRAGARLGGLGCAARRRLLAPAAWRWSSGSRNGGGTAASGSLDHARSRDGPPLSCGLSREGPDPQRVRSCRRRDCTTKAWPQTVTALSGPGQE